MDPFSTCLAQTLIWEGGYSDDAHDPGGKTMHGIIQSEYDAYRDRKGLPRQWVKLISDAELSEIYRNSYWNEVNADQLPPGVDLVTFDGGVNSGPSRGIRWLQMALGVEPDGHMGEITMTALKSADPAETIRKAVEARRSFLEQLGTFRYFGRGWLDRCAGIEHAALAMAGQNNPAPNVAPHVDADTQSASQGRAVPTPKPVHQTVTQSPSLRMQVAGVFLAVSSYFKDSLDAVSNFIQGGFNLVPGVQGDLEQFMSPAEKTAKAFSVPWDHIALGVGVACVVFSIIRQTGQKRTVSP